MNKITVTLTSLLSLLVVVSMPSAVHARTLSLDSCRAMALRANKQISIAKVEREVARNTRKAARTKYLPHVDANGGYMYSSRSISLLSDHQQNILSNLGTIVATDIGSMAPALAENFKNKLTSMVMDGSLSMRTAMEMGLVGSALGETLMGVAPQIVEKMNQAGQAIVDAFNTNTHHMFTASAMLTQPIYMGGAIKAGNNMADIAENIAEAKIDAKNQDVVYGVDNAYWMVVSLRQKQRLAESYLELVKKLDDDVHKMIREGVATRADGLRVDVAVNEADMAKTKVDNGLSLAKMLLCQLCGLDLDSDITLEDENDTDITIADTQRWNKQDGKWSLQARPELRMLSDAIDINQEKTKIARAGYLPQIGLTGGVIFTNPSVFNSFERKMRGMGVVGVVVRVPVLDWGETAFKIRAAKNSTTLARLAYEEAEEKMQLQASQCDYRLREANKQLVTATKNIESAEENLRCANIGFKEGVMQTSDVMAAQTAWLQAKTQRIDAEINVRLSETAMKKALGETGF